MKVQYEGQDNPPEASKLKDQSRLIEMKADQEGEGVQEVSGEATAVRGGGIQRPARLGRCFVEVVREVVGKVVSGRWSREGGLSGRWVSGGKLDATA